MLVARCVCKRSQFRFFGTSSLENAKEVAHETQMFHATTSAYDDWLHRVLFLQDMDFHGYVAHVEVVSRSSGQLGPCFVFDEHDIKCKTYWQRLAQHLTVPCGPGSCTSSNRERIG